MGDAQSNVGRPSGAGSGRRWEGKKPKRTTPWRKIGKLPEPPVATRPAGARWRKGGGGGKEEVAEGSAEALAVRVAQRGHEVSELYCSQLELGFESSKARARRMPQASSSKAHSKHNSGVSIVLWCWVVSTKCASTVSSDDTPRRTPSSLYFGHSAPFRSLSVRRCPCLHCASWGLSADA